MTDAEARLHRAFHWGLLTIADAPATELGDVDPDRAVTWAADHVHVLVRHADDVDPDVLAGLADDDEVPEALVAVTVHRPGTVADDAEHDGVVDVASGRLTVGDADDEHVIALPPGRWRVQVQASPADQPQHVEVWLSPAP